MMLHRIPANSKLIPSQGVGFKMPSKMPEVDKSESQELKGGAYNERIQFESCQHTGIIYEYR